MVKSHPPGDWVPVRREVIWIDCTPHAGREMRDIHPFLVLSPHTFNARTSLVLGLPMTTADYNATNPFAVVAGTTPNGRTSYILCHQIKSFDWRQRNASPHPVGKIPETTYREACGILNQILEIAPCPD